jgi:hypothetical protein
MFVVYHKTIRGVSFFKFLQKIFFGFAFRKGKGGVFCKEKVKDCKEKEKGVGVLQ